MLKVVDKHRARFASLNGDPDAKEFASQIRQVSRIRNTVMHPLSSKQIRESDFEAVADALQALVDRASKAVDTGNLDNGAFPSENVLVLPELLRERLFPQEVARST